MGGETCRLAAVCWAWATFVTYVFAAEVSLPTWLLTSFTFVFSPTCAAEAGHGKAE